MVPHRLGKYPAKCAGWIYASGYNYEDAILISEKLVKMIYIPYSYRRMNQRLGYQVRRKITRDIPNVGEETKGPRRQRNNQNRCRIVQNIHG